MPEASDATLEIDQQLLLALALMLRRAPALIRAQSFAAAVARWRAAAAGLDEPRADTVRLEFSGRPAGDAPPPRVNVKPHATGAEGQQARDATPQPSDAAGVQKPWSSAAGASTDGGDYSARTYAIEHYLRTPAAAEEVEHELRSAVAAHHAKPPSPTPADAALAATRAEGTVAPRPAVTAESPSMLASVTEAQADPVDTAFGGVFYLINLAIALGLYADFTQPLRPGIDVCVWDFLALVGVRLLGRKLRSDPLWRLLAALAGRPVDQPPGAEFDPVSLSAWLDTLTPRVRRALRRAIGPTGRRRVGRFVCAHRAIVLVTAGHVDIMLSLTDLPIAIRIAGLDRDPGWVPAAGRSIAFHYE